MVALRGTANHSLGPSSYSNFYTENVQWATPTNSPIKSHIDQAPGFSLHSKTRHLMALLVVNFWHRKKTIATLGLKTKNTNIKHGREIYSCLKSL